MKSNPFATRYVSPGQLPWLAPRADSLEWLINQFSTRCHRRAAIIGPHGSGKSTLLAHLLPHLGTTEDTRQPAFHVPKPNSTEERQIVRLQLRGRSHSRQLIWQHMNAWLQANTLLVLDGYEQLDRAMRLVVLAVSHARKAGLLVTSHHRTLLPTLIEVKVDVPLAQALVDRLLPSDIPDRTTWLDPNRLAQRLTHHRGNMRELLMEFYDHYESQSETWTHCAEGGR